MIGAPPVFALPMQGTERSGFYTRLAEPGSALGLTMFILIIVACTLVMTVGAGAIIFVRS